MRYYFIFIFVVFGLKLTLSQNYKYGKVSKDELLKEKSSIDPNASVEYLYKKEDISFRYDEYDGFYQVRTVHERIKIFDKQGFSWLTKKVKLYSRNSSNTESLVDLKGATYNIVNDKIEKTKLKKDGIFELETNKYWTQKSFTMPNAREGSVIEYSYEIHSPFLQIDDIDFQSTIPINKLYIKAKIPEFYVYNKYLNPKASFKPEIIESYSNSSINTFSRSSTGLVVKNSSASDKKMQYRENIFQINLDNIQGIVDEPYVDNLNNYKARLILELSAIKYPNEPIKTYSTSWENIADLISKEEGFNNQISKTNYYQKDLANVINKEEGNPHVILQTVLNYVKSKVKWNGFYGYISEKGVKRSYIEGSGNIADINLMLVSMLRSYNFIANPVLISTRGNGIPLTPTRDGFNYVICMVELEGESYLLDASDLNSSINVLPKRILNWQGIAIRKDGNFSWVNLNPEKLSNETIMVDAKISSDLKASGKVQIKLTDFYAMDYRNKYRGVNREEVSRYIEADNDRIVIKNLELKNEHQVIRPLSIKYNYECNNAIEEIGDNYYMSPMMFLQIRKNPYTQESRNYPINLDFPISKRYMINIEIPEGFKVLRLPESITYSYADNVGRFKYVIRQNESLLQIVMTLNINNSYILAKDYYGLKTFYESLIEKLNESIQLTKI